MNTIPVPALGFIFDGKAVECTTCSKCGGSRVLPNVRPDNGKCWKCLGIGFVPGKTTLGDWHNYYRAYRGSINPILLQQMKRLDLVPEENCK